MGNVVKVKVYMGQWSLGTKSKVTWIKVILRVILLAGVLTSTSSCIFFNSIGPRIGTSVTPPSMKSTEHGLNNNNNILLVYRGRYGEIMNYWQQVGADKQTMAKAYSNSVKYMESSKFKYRILKKLPHSCRQLKKNMQTNTVPGTNLQISQLAKMKCFAVTDKCKNGGRFDKSNFLPEVLLVLGLN